MRIYLVRHAQSEWQLAPSQDWDTGLSATGHEQAKRLGHWLAGHRLLDADRRLDVGAVLTSPLVRAQQTAAHVCDALGLPQRTIQELKEAEFHVASKLPSRAVPSDPDPAWEVPEKYARYKAQVAGALDLLVEAAGSGSSVLAVTHGGFMKTLLRVVMRQDDFCFRVYNTGIVELEWRRGRWHLVHLNLLDHVDAGLRTI